ncbi:jg10961 [Pararge aegeria aegeria]|uniref:Jg10961 protein n=1 Tax=Pararge aegeria aegeria TaxID=348720 RepID=A0A8S4S648_9NEOP|nr:jg10961 [Pararge aegeria aegeria]
MIDYLLNYVRSPKDVLNESRELSWLATHQKTVRNFNILFQFIIEPKSLEKEVKLQLPILLGTYPFRDADAEAHPPTHYPTTLPIFRPWLHDKQKE